MGDVAKAFGVTLPPSPTSSIRLEEKGWWSAAITPATGRVYVLDLTRAGKTLVDELEALRLRGMERVLARMAAAERRHVLSGLESLVDAAASVPEDEAQPLRGRRARK